MFQRIVFCLISSLALRVATAQTVPGGPYGFVAGVSQIDSAGANGGAFLGIMNFDGSGNVNGSSVIKIRSLSNETPQAVPSGFTGTYTANPDGTGSAIVNFDVGFTGTFSFVTTEGGQGIQLTDAACAPCTAELTLRGQGQSLAGNIPIQYFVPRAIGNIPVTLTAVNGTGTSVYTAAAATGSGAMQCDDGSTGTWTASIPSLTIIVNPPVTNTALLSGNYLGSIFGTFCGNPDFDTLSGLATGNVAQGGAATINLHATGSALNGVARAVKGGSLSGSYGAQFNFAPFPAGSVAVMKFDGAGTVEVSALNPTPTGPASVNLSGTYNITDDGTGLIALKNAAGQPAATFAFVVTDGGSQFLFLRIDSNPQFNVAWGTARQQ
jgi:hypothetical protein